MATDTTGSLVIGVQDGLKQGLKGPGPTITYVIGNPDAVLTSPTSSGLAIDWTNGVLYISLNDSGSTWYKLGSTT